MESLEHLGPLHGVKVLEVATVIAGPYAGSLLSLLGADVIKVEPMGAGDPIRQWTTPRGPTVFNQMNAGKRSISVNLSDPAGQDVLRRLVPEVDVLINNLRPGRMDDLGLGSKDCLALNPQLVYVAISGYGGVGPLGFAPGYDGIGQAFSGLTSLLTAPGARPRIGPALADLSTGLVSMAGVMIGLYARSQTDEGQVVETSLIESVITMIADQFGHYQGNGAAQDFERRARVSQIFSLATADERYLLVHVSTSEKFYQALLDALGRTDLRDDPRFATYPQRVDAYDELVEELERTTQTLPMEAWEERFAAVDVPHSPVLSIEDVFAHPQFDALDLFAVTEERTGLRVPGAPWRVNGARAASPRVAPNLGEHTASVLSQVCTESELAELERRGVIQVDRG